MRNEDFPTRFRTRQAHVQEVGGAFDAFLIY